MPFRDVEDRYLRDPVFHNMVDALEAAFEQLQFTPTEAREAVMFAQVRFESRHPRFFFCDEGGQP